MELILLLSVLASTPEASLELLQVQEGYSKQLIASEPQIMDPVAFCFDDDGNILVAESFRQEQGVEDNRSSAFWLHADLGLQNLDDRYKMYEYYADQRVNGMEYYKEFEDRIRKLQDTNGDGVYETATIFADGFNDPMDGTGAGVIALNGEVWYTNIPHIWKFDESGTVKTLFGDVFGVRTALRGHDMHGLALGLDGRMYWSIGDRGYHLKLEDGTVLHSPGEGAVFRCEFDGSDLQVYHHGLRNPQELAFDSYGNLFTGDNNSDSVDKARLVYCVEGGETGWRMEYQTLSGANERGPWVTENGWDPHSEDRPAWILPAIDTLGSGPSGLVAYPGAGLSDRYNNHFFLCNFRGGAEYSNVLSFAVEPDGAHFTLVDEHPFVEKVLCTDVDFSYDGKMVISDWGEGWTGNYEGRLYSVWDEEHVAEGDVSELFATGFDSLESERLIGLLHHVDRRVRVRAQYELANREEASMFVSLLASPQQLSRIHAMWGLAMIDRNASLPQMKHIVPLLQDDDAEIRAQACKILGESAYTPAFKQVESLIGDTNARVSYFATIASGHLGNAHDAIVSMLETNGDQDVYLRHAGVVALANSQYPSSIANLQGNMNASVRLAAVLALRKLKSPFVVDFLLDTSDAVATEAARAIHDARIQGAMRALAETLPVARTIPWQKRAISACKLWHNKQASALVAAFASDSTKPNEMRLLAVQALRNWDPGFAPNREIVEGRIIVRKHMDRFEMADVRVPLEKLIQEAEGELLLETMHLVKELKMTFPTGAAKRFVEDESLPIEIRAFAIEQTLLDDVVMQNLQNDKWQLRSAARKALQKRDTESARELLLDAALEGNVFEAQQAILALGNDPIGFAKLDKEAIPLSLQFEYAQAAGNTELFGTAIVGEWLLHGGNATAGRRVVFENSRSECLRCHKVNNRGGIAGPSLDGVADRLDAEQLRASLLEPNKEVTDGFGEYSAMPAMGTLLNDRELRDIIAYLQTLHQEE